MAWVRSMAVVVLLVGGLTAITPTASACSLVGYSTLADLAWPTDDRLDTNVGNGPGRVSLDTGRLLALLDQYSFSYAASPDGRWLVVSYFDGSLGADCTMEFVTTDALDLVTGDRHRLFDAATHATAVSDDHLFLSAYECGPVVHAFRWGDWDEPERILLDQASGAPDEFEHVTGLAVNKAATRLAVAVDGDAVYAFDMIERLFKEGNAPLGYSRSMRGPAFAIEPDGLRVAVAQGDWDEMRVGVYDSTLHFELLASYDYPRADGDDRPAGAPAWQPEGGALAFASTRVLKVIDADETTRQVALPSSASFLGTPAWSPAGDRLAIGTQGVSSGDVSLAIYKESMDLDRRISWNNAYPDVSSSFASWDPPIDEYDVEPRHTCASGVEADPPVPIPTLSAVFGLVAIVWVAVGRRR